MASWNEPNNSDPNHVNVLSNLGDKDTYAASMGQNGGTFTDRPEGLMLYDNVSKLFKRLTSSIELSWRNSLSGSLCKILCRFANCRLNWESLITALEKCGAITGFA